MFNSVYTCILQHTSYIYGIVVPYCKPNKLEPRADVFWGMQSKSQESLGREQRRLVFRIRTRNEVGKLLGMARTGEQTRHQAQVTKQ